MDDWVSRYPVQSRDARMLRKALQRAITEANMSLERVAIAVSGGPDSALLAVEASLLARQDASVPHIIHIHHGLQETADAWLNRVHDLAHILGLPCHSRVVSVPSDTGKGTEAAARDARYQALSDMSTSLGITHVLLAHHLDDQAETVLLRLLRGSGPTGLSAMAPATRRGALTLLRPWLDVPRVAIMQQMHCFFMATGWSAVYDPTNHHDSYTRSAVRERLAPALNQRWPGWQRILGRHARLSAQTADILHEVAQADFAGLEPDDTGHSFSLALWRQLSHARQAHVLRYWLGQCGLRAPTQARLDDMMRQLRGLHALGHDRQMRVRHAHAWVHCHKGRVGIEMLK